MESSLDSKRPLRAISGEFTIRRYYALAPDRSGPDSITITNDLCYFWSQEDRDVQAAFDHTTGRAYYFAHYH